MGIANNNNTLSFHELPEDIRLPIERKRLDNYCRKVYKKKNSFCVDIVRTFRDRHYEYKDLHKQWKKNLANAIKKDDL
ncbi:unnamed protein product [Rotaria sordida]|uniref:DNA polymerase epsilon catalytic subunit n=1 Tax=Rotaria sordida TaxID=392033 RepID=A0A815K0Z6_9BILA|nr:unnamed protein product [Rotaria sordida]